jgi:hypothetical protein
MSYPNGDRIVLHVHGVLERLEMYPRKRPAIITIRRPDLGVEWSFSLHTNIYSEKVLPPGSESTPPEILEGILDQDWSDDGTEMIDDRSCLRLVGRYRNALLGRDSHTVCYVDAQTGMRRRESCYDVIGELVATTDYLPAPPPLSHFELPEGCKRVDQG